jgi:hypothetical protein
VFHSVYDDLFQPYTYLYPPPHMTNMYPPPHMTVFPVANAAQGNKHVLCIQSAWKQNRLPYPFNLPVSQARLFPQSPLS